MGYERLKPGPGKSPERVRASQRARIRRAVIELAGDAGHERVTVRGLTRTAGVSSRSFYGHFVDREECLADTVGCIGRELLYRAMRRSADVPGWEAQLRTSVDSLLGDIAERPKAARLLFVEALAAGLPARTCATRLTADLERMLAHLFADAPPRRLVIGIAAGVVRVMTTTTLTDRADELPEMADELTDWVLGVCDEKAIALCAHDSEEILATRRDPPRFPRHRRDPINLCGPDGERDRMFSAVVKLASVEGFAALTPSRIRREAGVSRQCFQTNFRDAADCYLAAIESIARLAIARADEWAGAADGSGRRTYRTMLALSAQAARNPALAHLVLVGILAPGREGLVRRERLLAAAAEHLGSPSSHLSVAAAWRVAESEVDARRTPQLPRIAPLLSGLVIALA